MATEDNRLLLISSRVRNKPAMYSAVRPNIKVVEYNFDSHGLDEILGLVGTFLAGLKMTSIAMVVHSSERDLFVCAPGESKLSLKSVIGDEKIRNFFKNLVKEFLDKENWSARLDFLATYMAEQIDGGLLAKELETMLDVHVGMSKNLEGSDIQVTMKRPGVNGFSTVGEMYFDMPTLQAALKQVGKVTKDGQRKLEK